MIEYKAYHKKSLGRKPMRAHTARKRRKGAASRAGRPGIRLILPVVAALLLIAGATAAGAAAYSWLGRSTLFSVRDVDMNPCAQVTRDEVAGMLAGGKDGTIWSLSAEAIGRRLLTHPWIREVSVRKVFPDRLVVRIEERHPAAMINLDALYYVDEEGDVFKRLSAYDSKNYPIITGFSRTDLSARDTVALRNLRRTIDLLHRAESGVLRQNVSEIHFDPQEGFTLVTRDTGLALKIGTMEPQEAMQRIEEALPKLSRLGKVRGVVDLKYAGRIFVRPGE
jgi:cell division protein FtsQ